MKTITDKIFGEINYDLFWQKEDSFTWNNKSYPVTVIIRAANEQAPTEKQQDCYVYFKKNSPDLIESAIVKLLKYCKDNYDNSLTAESIHQKLIPREIVFRRTGRWGITFDSPWENERRLAIAFKDDVVTAGTDDLLI